MSKIIHTTHIDTGGHGYYSVSKKDIELLGIKDKITGYSGLSLTRVYLEEDQDGTLLANTCKEKGIAIKVKSGYNLAFKITHNYRADLFDYVPACGDKVIVSGKLYEIIEVHVTFIIVYSNGRYRIPLSNPFKFIEQVIKD